mmetsp:Transcript_11654/g.34914  ORF Transcript_11654/g.34914 Transcript_11654/m.34914 type:complete len:95 (-) Transcript_11654:26-310(-)
MPLSIVAFVGLGLKRAFGDLAALMELAIMVYWPILDTGQYAGHEPAAYVIINVLAFLLALIGILGVAANLLPTIPTPQQQAGYGTLEGGVAMTS